MFPEDDDDYTRSDAFWSLVFDRENRPAEEEELKAIGVDTIEKINARLGLALPSARPTLNLPASSRQPFGLLNPGERENQRALPESEYQFDLPAADLFGERVIIRESAAEARVAFASVAPVEELQSESISVGERHWVAKGFVGLVEWGASEGTVFVLSKAVGAVVDANTGAPAGTSEALVKGVADTARRLPAWKETVRDSAAWLARVGFEGGKRVISSMK